MTLLIGSALPFALAAGAAQQDEALFQQIGTLERFPADARAILGSNPVPESMEKTDPGPQRGAGGTMIMIPEARQIWQLYFTVFPQTERFTAVVRDLDTLKIKTTVPLGNCTFCSRTGPIPFSVDRATLEQWGGEWAHAIDRVNHRLFLVQVLNKSLLEIDLKTFAIKERPLLSTYNVANAIFPISVAGLTYDPYEDDLLVLYGGPSGNLVLDTNTLVYRMDVSVPPPAQAPVAPLYQLRGCGGPVSSVDSGGKTMNWEILVTKEHLFVPCHRAGQSGAIVRILRSSITSNPQEDVVVGPVYVETVMADQAGGRIFMATVKRDIWVFEASTMSFIGIVATGTETNPQPVVGYGLDPATGRLYFQSPTFGLGVAEGRFFPLPQARTTSPKAGGQERIFSDARTGRVFVLEGSDDKKVGAYKIYSTGRAPIPPSPPDPDRNTVDMAEQPGMTEPRYFASASGYGARVLLSKGVSTIAPAPTVGLIAPTAQAIDKNLNPKCGYTDRELVSGRVFKAEYDTGSTAATAIGFDVDGATKQDLDQPARCDIPIRNSGTEVFKGFFATAPALDERTTRDDKTTRDVQESRWSPKPASCSSSDGNVPEPTSGKPDGDFKDLDEGSSTVECPAPGGRLRATALGRLSGGLEVARTYTETEVSRPGSGGVRSTVTSVAEGVVIAGVIRIGEIRSVATSTSNGRPQTKKMSAHAVTIKDVTIGDATVDALSLCKNVCNNAQELRNLVDVLNLAAGGKVQFRTGAEGSARDNVNSGRDERLLQGTPKGALTAVQKSEARQASDQALVGDFTNEVPGLEMTVFNDNPEWGRARQVYQFAGVATAATYNIVLRPSGFGPDGDSAFNGGLPLNEDGNTPFGGMIEGLAGGSNAFGAPLTASSTDDADDDGSGFLAPFRALARGIRMFLTNPRQSLLLLTAWLLFTLPAVLSRRRRLLADTRSV